MSGFAVLATTFGVTALAGFFLIAALTGRGLGVATIISPVIMTELLRNVSGVSLLEKTLLKTKPDYQEYVRRTRAFFPWFPKR